MSILISGIEMPKVLGKTITIFPNGTVRVWVNNKGSGELLEQRAIPVPDHGRLIDADALCKTLRSLAENEYTPEVFANWIENHIDTIIQASKEGEG